MLFKAKMKLKKFSWSKAKEKKVKLSTARSTLKKHNPSFKIKKMKSALKLNQMKRTKKLKTFNFRNKIKLNKINNKNMSNSHKVETFSRCIQFNFKYLKNKRTNRGINRSLKKMGKMSL